MAHRNFNIMAFPAGSRCNLDCDYCYYSNESALYPDRDDYMMSEKVLEEYIKQYVEALSGPGINFGWQGGEPMLRGLDFFRRAFALQDKYVPAEWELQNSFQTNGTLLNGEWAHFLAEHEVLVGISIDGPSEIHNTYRTNREHKPSFAGVRAGLEFLQEYEVDYNILCVVHEANADYPQKVYDFFRNLGAEFVQFIPLVETDDQGQLTERSVKPDKFGRFMIEIFNQWLLNKDIGDVFVRTIEQCMAAWSGYQPGICVMQKTCGQAAVLEFNGDLYCCDHFVYPEYKLGNIMQDSIDQLMAQDKMEKFGQDKLNLLNEDCRECEYSFTCHGGCPKNRSGYLHDLPGDCYKNYLCAGYYRFFDYIDPFMKEAEKRIKKRQHPRLIQKKLRKIYDKIWSDVGRNDPCPCGSGKKYKKCCL